MNVSQIKYNNKYWRGSSKGQIPAKFENTTNLNFARIQLGGLRSSESTRKQSGREDSYNNAGGKLET
jgi:hypothetical protein